MTARAELELLAFAVAGWFLKPRTPPGARVFTHHQEVGWSTTAAVFAALVLVEGTLVHVWLSHTGLVALTWSAFALHVVVLVWIVGDAHALRLRRSYLVASADGTTATLELRVGARARGTFPLTSIAEVSTGEWATAAPGERSVAVSGPANVKIAFRHPVELKCLLAAPVAIQGLLLQVDEPQRFARALTDR
ncbi:MAG TPA: hypothetical protein VGK73_24415 [Polyangiaceae bacterium]